MSVADYVLGLTGIDPAAKWRGVYSTEEQARAFQDEAGGNLELVRDGMLGAGFSEIEQPTVGAVVVADVGSQVTGIWTGRGAMFRRPGRGVAEMPAKILGAWA